MLSGSTSTRKPIGASSRVRNQRATSARAPTRSPVTRDWPARRPTRRGRAPPSRALGGAARAGWASPPPSRPSPRDPTPLARRSATSAAPAQRRQRRRRRPRRSEPRCRRSTAGGRRRAPRPGTAPRRCPACPARTAGRPPPPTRDRCPRTPRSRRLRRHRLRRRRNSESRAAGPERRRVPAVPPHQRQHAAVGFSRCRRGIHVSIALVWHACIMGRSRSVRRREETCPRCWRARRALSGWYRKPEARRL